MIRLTLIFHINSNNFATYEERDTLWCLLWRNYRDLIMQGYLISMIQTKKIDTNKKINCVSRCMAVSWTMQLSCLKQFRQIQVNLRSHQHGQHRKNWKPYSVGRLLSSFFLIRTTDRWNGNSTELSPIQSVIIPVIKQNQTSAERESNLFMKSIITDKIRRHEVLLPINHKYYFPAILEGQKSGEVTKSSI